MDENPNKSLFLKEFLFSNKGSNNIEKRIHLLISIPKPNLKSTLLTRYQQPDINILQPVPECPLISIQVPYTRKPLLAHPLHAFRHAPIPDNLTLINDNMLNTPRYITYPSLYGL